MKNYKKILNFVFNKNNFYKNSRFLFTEVKQDEMQYTLDSLKLMTNLFFKKGNL